MRYPEVRLSEQELLRDVFGALSRFGSDRETRARWLLDFIERDLGSQEAALQASLQLFLFIVAGRVTGDGASAPARMNVFTGEESAPEQVREVFSSIKRLQREAKETLTAFASEGRCTLAFKIVGLERLPNGHVLPIVGGDWRSRFFGAVFMLAVELGRDLGVCANPKCRKLFLRSKRQAYHDVRCSQRERTQRFREKHPERVKELRHSSHVQRQRKRLGPRVKVGRRVRGAVRTDRP